MTRYYTVLLMLFCFIPTAFSQSKNVSDTLNLAKQLRSKGKIHKSYKILKKAYSDHPDNLNVAWLTAQTAFWANRIGRSRQIYEKAILSSPKNLYLQLDYAKMLVNTADFMKAIPLLNVYLSYDSTNAQALTALSRAYFWMLKYPYAGLLVTKAHKSDPKYPDASSLIRDISLARAPYLKISAGYCSDDQPLQTLSTTVGAGFYFNPLSSFHFTFQSPFLIREGKMVNAYIFDIGNSSFFSKANMTIGIDAGVVKFPVKSNYTWTGNFEIDKTFIKHLVLSLSVQRNPYFTTLSSIDSMVIQHHFTGSIGWNDQNKWNGQIAAEAFAYPLDHNLTYTGYAWVFAPPIKFSVFRLRFGYGYNYSNSQKNRYVSTKTLEEIIAGFSTNSIITGVYNPYYTPNDQQIHSLLLSFTSHPLKWLDLSLNANAGFYATTQVPYLYLDKNANDSTILKTGFSSATFLPLTLRLQALIKVSDCIHIQAEYTYMKTYYYTSQYAGIGINIRFPDEKKSS